MSPVALQRRTSRRGLRVPVPAPAKQVRAALYCRKSTDENLHSDFNSLDAQREACQAYVASMRSEGWIALPQRYEDAAFSGGTTDRPGLQRLLGDIESGQVDAVVVVKIDRLSRSLLQFLQLMEHFEEHKIAFCAVTQQINTASSAGRLLVNVLMSFAQFERELGSERTREKVHAARKKGRYIGGPAILGFDVDRAKHCLVVNAEEADCVREIFQLYLERRSLIAVVRELNGRGWTRKLWTNGDGHRRGGRPWDKVALHRLLSNPVVIGKVTLEKVVYPGQQEAIVDEDTFAQVQKLLCQNGNGQGGEVRNKHGALLKGILKCGACGCAMAHTYTKKGNRLYRYYSCSTTQKQGKGACPTPSLPAGEIEAFVVEQIRMLARDPALVREVFAEATQMQKQQVHRLESEKSRLQKQRIQREAERQRLVSAMGVAGRPVDAVVQRLGEIEAEVAVLAKRMGDIEIEMGSQRGTAVDLDHMTATLADFDGLWDVLIPAERSRLVHLLVERVVCSAESEIQVAFRTAEPG